MRVSSSAGSGKTCVIINVLQGNFRYALPLVFPLLFLFPLLLLLLSRARFFAWKAFGKVIIIVVAARWRVYGIYAHHGNSKGNPRRQAPTLQVGVGRAVAGRELHIVIDFNAFHCWCHVPSFISSMYNTGMPRPHLPSRAHASDTTSKNSLSVRVCVCAAGAGQKRRASDCTLLRFQTHTLLMPATCGMHLLHGLDGARGPDGRGGGVGYVRWTQMIAALCGASAKCHSHNIAYIWAQ